MKHIKKFKELNEGWKDNYFPHLDIYADININDIENKIVDGLDSFGKVNLKVFRNAEDIYLQIRDDLGLFGRKVMQLGTKLPETDEYKWIEVSYK